MGLVQGLSRTVIDRLERQASDPRERQSKSIDRIPYESDVEVARLCAFFVVREPDPASRRWLWEPWVRLAPVAPAWTEDFLNAVYGEGLTGPRVAPYFLTAITEIFESAFESEGWLKGSDRSDVARALLGHAKFATPESRWSSERQEIACALKVHWRRWSEIALNWQGCADALLGILRSPAAKGFRIEAISWLEELGNREQPLEERTESALVGFLEVVHEENPDELVANPDAIRVFELLLHDLVSRQQSRAILLAKHVSEMRPVAR